MHARQGLQRGLDLAQLNAVAAQLHLKVAAAQQLDVAVGTEPRQVARAVQALPGRERVGDEVFGRQRRLVQVATRQAGATDEQLTGHAHRHRLAVAAQHITLRVRDRPAYRYGSLRGQAVR